MARGCQVQGHCNVEGQREDWEVPLAEDGAQGTGKDGAGGGNMRGTCQVLFALALDHTAAKNPAFPRGKSAWCLPFLRPLS